MLLLGSTLTLRHPCVSLSSHSFRPVERIGSRAARCCSYAHYFVPCCPFLSWYQQSNVIVSFYSHGPKLPTSTCRAGPQSTLFSSVPDMFCLRLRHISRHIYFYDFDNLRIERMFRFAGLSCSAQEHESRQRY